MSVEIIELTTSRKFTTSAKEGTGEWKFTLRVEDEAFPETAIIAAVAAEAPFFWYNLVRQELQAEPMVGREDGGLYTCTVPYLWEYQEGRAQDPTASPDPDTGGPGGGPPSGTPSGPAGDDTIVGPNVTIEIGGRPPKLTTSISVVDDGSAGGGGAPDHGKVINYNRSTNEVDGVEIEDPSSRFNIEMVFDYVTYGYVTRLEGAMWHKNDDTFFRRSAGSVAFIGATLSSDSNSRAKVNFQFGTRPPSVIEAQSLRDDMGLELPLADVNKRGWDYLEIEYENEAITVTGGKLIVAKPVAFRIHEVLPDFDYTLFGIGA